MYIHTFVYNLHTRKGTHFKYANRCALTNVYTPGITPTIEMQTSQFPHLADSPQPLPQATLDLFSVTIDYICHF